VTVNAIVGGMFTSRINRNLREARAITYGARSAFDMRRAGGLFAVDSSVQPDATTVALTEISSELAGMRADASVTAAELEQAKASLTRGYVRHFETSGQLMRALAQLAIYQLPDDSFDQFVPAIEGLTLPEITAAARSHLHPDLATLVVVGDLEQLEKPLATLGRPLRALKPEF
jgi:predicted Zn-dependent peptidase